MDKPTYNSERIAYYDNIKFLMIVLMVIGHFVGVFTENSSICRSIYLFIYAFHMPLLIFVSGLFYENKNNTSKVLFYICCGFALKMALALTNLICYQSASFQLLSDSGIPWFLFVLAAYQMMMYGFRSLDKRFLLVFITLLACFLGYDTSVTDHLYISRIVIFFPFYLSGTMLAPKRDYPLTANERKWILPALFIMAIWFYLCFYKTETVYVLRHLFNGRSPFSEEIADYGPLARVLCYSITVLTGSSLLVLIPKKRIPFFTSLGARTLNVYFWHWIAYRFLNRFLHITRLFKHGSAGKISFLLIGVSLSIVLASFKVFDFPLNIIKRYCFKAKPTVSTLDSDQRKQK